MSKRKVLLIRVGSILAAIVVMDLLVRLQIVSRSAMPFPMEVLQSLGDDIRDGTLIRDAGTTVLELTMSLILAALIGLLFGYVFWAIPILGRALIPIIAAAFSSPVVLLYPISLVLFGRSSTAIIFMAVLYGSLPIIVFVYRALTEVPVILHNVADSMVLNRREKLFHVMLPACAPQVTTGLRLGTAYVLITVIAMEFLVQIGGLGASIQLASLRFNTPEIYAKISVVIVLSALAISAMQWLERIVRR